MLPRGVMRGLVQAWVRAKGASVHYERDCVRITRGSRSILLAPAHDIYAPTMLEHFDTYWGAVRDTDGVVDFSRPSFHIYRHNGLGFWMSSMPEEPDAIDGYLVEGKPNAGAVVYDIGANTGVTTYHLSQLVGPTGRVVAFEPDPTSYEMLGRNVLRHRLENVTTVQAAVSDRDGVAEFNADATLGATLSAVVNRNGKTRTAEVPTITLASAFNAYGVPSFIKMDIEGAEIEALEAARPVLRQYRPRLAIDTHHRRGGWLGGVLSGAYTTAEVARILSACGYAVHSDQYGGFWTTWAR